jgi:hypothetical protein
MLLRAITIGFLLVGLEIVQGILRVRLLNRRLGDHRARQVGVFIGSVVILVVAWCCSDWMGAKTRAELLGVGALWLGLMLACDLFFGRVVFRFSWSRIARDFDPRCGGLLGLGMLVLLLAPWIGAWLRSVE